MGSPLASPAALDTMVASSRLVPAGLLEPVGTVCLTGHAPGGGGGGGGSQNP